MYPFSRWLAKQGGSGGILISFGKISFFSIGFRSFNRFAASPDPDEIVCNIGNWTLENEVRIVLFVSLSPSLFFFIPILSRKRFSGVEFDEQINPTGRRVTMENRNTQSVGG